MKKAVCEGSIALLVAFAVFGASSAEKFNHSAVSWLPAVAGHPFSGKLAVTITVRGAKTEQLPRLYSIYRDSAGRTLSVPARAGTYDTRFSEIDDLVHGNWYILDSATRQCTEANSVCLRFGLHKQI